MSNENWPTEPLIMIAKGSVTIADRDRDIDSGSLAIRDPDDGWYWVAGYGWLYPTCAEISEYVPVIPVSLDGSLGMTWFTQYAPEGFMATPTAAEKVEAPTEKYRKATDFMSTWEGMAIGEDISAVEVVAHMDLDDDTDILKLAAGAYCGGDVLCSEAAERASKGEVDTDRANLLRLAFKVDNSEDGLTQMRACSELAVAALARWEAMQ